jgi:hypothetical protein
MSEEKQQKNSAQTEKAFFWDDNRPNIGVCVKRMTGKRGEFYSFEPLRSYRKKRDGELKTCYTHSFTEEDAEAFGNVIVWALGYIRANRPLEAPEQLNGTSQAQLQAVA